MRRLTIANYKRIDQNLQLSFYVILNLIMVSPFFATARPLVPHSWQRHFCDAIQGIYIYSRYISPIGSNDETLDHYPFCMAWLEQGHHRITGRSYREEATKPSYDLLAARRTRRHHWLGHILRMAADRLVRRAVLALGQRTGPPY